MMRKQSQSIAVLAAVLAFTLFVDGKAGLMYVETSSGVVLVAKELALPRRETTDIMTTKSHCDCKMACFVKPSCQAWSSGLISNRVKCKLSDAGPSEYKHKFLNSTRSNYYFIAESVPGEYSVKGDELLYLSVPEKMTVDEAQAFCGKIPGHRLAIIKTLQQKEAIHELLNSTGINYFVDLKVTTAGPTWGDGTLYNETHMGNAFPLSTYNKNPNSVFIMTQKGSVEQESPKSLAHVLCQANPFDRDW